MPIIKLDEFEAEELIRGLFELSDDQDVEEKLFDEFGIDFEQWMKIAGALIILTPVVESRLTKYKYHAFIKEGIAIAKVIAKGEA